MRRLLLRWVVTTVPLLLGISALTFVLAAMVPGDAARALVGVNGTEDQYLHLRDQLGLDLPLWQRYATWLDNAVHGDLGTSIVTGDSVARQIGVRFAVTLSILLGAIVVAGVVGVTLGLVSAVRGGRVGKVVDVVSLLGSSIPNYWFGLVLATCFGVLLRVFPATGYVELGQSPRGWFGSLVLPWLTLGLTSSALVAKQTRDGVLTELRKEYVTVLRARGVSPRRVILVHVLRNAGTPIVTVLGLVFIGLLSGAVLVETVFVLPGLGSLAVASTSSHDVPVIQGVALVMTLFVVVANLVVELINAGLNPKVRS